ncbi:hypothetical protein [Paludisphaera rhizosphaerae]|uniref:hypothetical protein n=1 Tax=Paludisphaera rhizosphaerae TaxID=2711216 RepID=UPI0013EB1DFE|nr:hypothetical protein [Paludisphaera rhizosphaerae]
MPLRRLHLAVTVFLTTIVQFAAAEEAASPAKRGGLVELYPSQGCDMCPAAENPGISGENAGKTLIARYPARRTEYDLVELSGSAPVSRQFSFTIDPS